LGSTPSGSARHTTAPTLQVPLRCRSSVPSSRDAPEGASSISRGAALAQCRGFGTFGWNGAGRWSVPDPAPPSPLHSAAARGQGPTRRDRQRLSAQEGRLGCRQPGPGPCAPRHGPRRARWEGPDDCGLDDMAVVRVAGRQLDFSGFHVRRRTSPRPVLRAQRTRPGGSAGPQGPGGRPWAPPDSRGPQCAQRDGNMTDEARVGLGDDPAASLATAAVPTQHGTNAASSHGALRALQ
jgi:hypothetical protein